jgi:homopolymeric O-antigen transport system permease protein
VRTEFNMTAGLRELWRRRDLVWIMTVTQVRARYKQSVLGFAWAVLQPLALMFVFTFVFSKLLGVTSEGIPYPLFSYAALTFWSFFSTSMTLGVPSMIVYGQVLKKVYFPREIIPLVTVLATLFDLAIAGAVFAVLMWYYGVAVTGALAWLPVLLAVQILLTTGVVFVVSTICVKFRDIQWGVPVLMQLWLYCTPVIYSLDVIPERWRPLAMLNPMAGLIDGYRRVLLHGQAPDALGLGLAAVVSLAAFWFGYRYLKRREMTFADIV